MNFTDNINYLTTKNVENKLTKKQSSPKRLVTLFKFCKVIQKAFDFKTEKSVENIIKKWYKILKKECNIGKKLEYAHTDNIYEANRINYREIIKIINLSKITKILIKPEIGFIFSITLVYSTFVFEQTAIDLTLENIYDIFSNNIKKEYSKSKFIQNYFEMGTSKEVQNILYNKNI